MFTGLISCEVKGSGPQRAYTRGSEPAYLCEAAVLAVASILTIVAAALAVLVVGRISGSNDRFRQSILATA